MNDSQSRIENLAAWLDKVLPPGQRGIRKETQDPLLKAAVDFAKAPFPELSPEAMTRVRARMLSAYTPTRHVIRFPNVRRLSMVASLAIVLLVAGLVPATAASLPGETLYPVKLRYESVELLVAAGLHKEGEMYVVHSERRLAEAETLLRRGVFSQETFSAALTNASHALEADPDGADRVHSLVTEVGDSLASAQRTQIVDQSVIDVLEADLLIVQAAADEADVFPPTPVPTSTNTPAEAVPSVMSPTQEMLIVVPVTHTAMPTSTASSTATLTAIPTETETHTLTPTVTATATETATVIPTATRTPRPRPVPTRIPTLQASDAGANGQSADAGSQGNDGNGQPADPGNQGNNGNNENGQPDNSGSQGNNGKPDDPDSNGNLGQGQSNPPSDNSSSNNAGGNSGDRGK